MSQPLDCRVLTDEGWRELRDITAGQTLVTVDGDRQKVRAVELDWSPMLHVETNDRCRTKCSENHLWHVGIPDQRELTSVQIRDFLLQGRMVNIPVVSPPRFELWTHFVDRYIPPYRMGQFAAQGSVDEVPEAYLAASVPERVELLQGMFDEAAWVGACSDLVFATDRLETMEMVQEMVQGMGGLASLTRERSGTLEVTIRLPLWVDCPFRDGEKRAKWERDSGRRLHPNRRLTGVDEALVEREGATLVLDDPLYITDYYIVTMGERA